MKFVDKIIKDINSSITTEGDIIKERFFWIRDSLEIIKGKLESISKSICENNRKDAIIEEQAKAINLLLGNIGDFHDTQMFIYQSYRGAPVAFINGERVDREKMKSMTVWWSVGEYPSVEVE